MPLYSIIKGLAYRKKISLGYPFAKVSTLHRVISEDQAASFVSTEEKEQTKWHM